MAMWFKSAFEREGFRITPNGQISRRLHPKSLGEKLTHPFITTDFAEAQLELLTPPLSGKGADLRYLRHLHQFVLRHIDDELIWPLSMPPPYKSPIKRADYGPSEEGTLKEMYREGIIYRYGERMQLISGIHYNFNFQEKRSSEDYLSLIRNYLRHGYLITYLFGASPVADSTYHTRSYPDATSLRMSHIGYYSRIADQLAVSFNNFEEYIRDMEWALTTTHPKYKKLSADQQINDKYFQRENEHYVRIRPKCGSSKMRPMHALMEQGIEYVEVRAFDVNPFSPIGITKEETDFLALFLTHLDTIPSKPLSEKDQHDLTDNQNRVALHGRQEGLKLKKNGDEILFKTKALNFLRSMRTTAKKYGMSDLLEGQIEKVLHPHLTPSARVLAEMEREGLDHLGFGLKKAKEHKEALLRKKCPQAFFKKQEKLVQLSIVQKRAMDQAPDFLFKGYEDMEISTQILIKEALNRGYQVEILDRGANFVRITHKKSSHLIKQATFTPIDSVTTYFAMESKLVTKKLLKEKGFQVPISLTFDECRGQKVVVKPTHANFGEGITICSEPSEVKTAITHAKTYDDDVIIETFQEGREFRFLVVGDECVGIVYREPANVIGDGLHSVAELVHLKNLDPKSYKYPKIHLKLGAREKNELKAQGLTPRSVVAKGKKIYLRKNSNVSTGGDPIEAEDQVHPSYQKIAIDAAKAAGAKICGVDIIIKEPKRASKDHAIIELNFNPTLAIHRFPYRGVIRHVEKTVLDLLF